MVFRKRRSTSFSKDESKTSADVPAERSNGNRNWFDQSKRDIRKVERTKKRKEKKGKMPSSHLQSQRLIGGKNFFFTKGVRVSKRSRNAEFAYAY